MKCIKEQCKYYERHQFNESWRVCGVDNRNMKYLDEEDYSSECYIEKDVNIAKRRFLIMQADFEYIRNANKIKEHKNELELSSSEDLQRKV